MSHEPVDQAVFTALADPTRRRLIEILSAAGDRTATELARELPITRQGVTKHLRILADADLVSVRQEGRDRLYTLRPEHLGDAVSWVDRVRTQWARRLVALSDYLDELSEQEVDNG